jgi:uncharacterized protein
VSPPWTVAADGLIVTVRLTPKGGRDAIDGIETLSDATAVLKARVRAAPSDGAANDALVRLIARSLDLAPREVSLVAGAASRVKRLRIAGDGPALAQALAKLVR